MDRVFLDANVLVSAALKPGSTLHELWKRSDVRLLASPYVVEEARRNVSGPAGERLGALLESVDVLPAEPADFATAGAPGLPAKDRPVLLAAVVARADYLVTGDITHFGPCMGRSVEGVLVLLPGQYLRER